jgi:hypothetical protein
MCSIQESDVKDALKRMEEVKAMCSDGIPIEVWRSLRGLTHEIIQPYLSIKQDAQ